MCSKDREPLPQEPVCSLPGPPNSQPLCFLPCFSCSVGPWAGVQSQTAQSAGASVNASQLYKIGASSPGKTVSCSDFLLPGGLQANVTKVRTLQEVAAENRRWHRGQGGMWPRAEGADVPRRSNDHSRRLVLRRGWRRLTGMSLIMGHLFPRISG